MGVRTGPTARQHEAVVEVPRDLVRRKLARRAALAVFSAGEQRLAWPYDEDALWCEDRHPVMNERPCDFEDDGIRAWRIPSRNRSLNEFDP